MQKYRENRVILQRNVFISTKKDRHIVGLDLERLTSQDIVICLLYRSILRGQLADHQFG